MTAKNVSAWAISCANGGHKHWSGGDKNDGALFYEEGSAKFDLIPAK